MKILVLGGGGREHALIWKIRQSPHVTWLGCAPGNGGIHTIAEPVELDIEDPEAVAKYAFDNNIDLTVVGPEAPLAAGVVDAFKSPKNLIFGPSSKAARIESSKKFSKDLMASAGVPTAAYRAFDRADQALEYIDEAPVPMVIKASGLAAGKGVLICMSRDEARSAVEEIMLNNAFGNAGSEIIIEEFLEGPEVSLFAITDGMDYLLLAPSQDHKRIGEGDTGPNTGGMGAYAPAPMMDEKLLEQCAREVFEPTLHAMRESGSQYKGLLYAGLMLTKDGPKVLEFNCRFGDPETQVVLPLLKVDIVDLMLLSATQRMGDMLKQFSLKPTNWRAICHDKQAATIILASAGYPGSYEKGKVISDFPENGDDLLVFHAGTKQSNNEIITSGGRVLAVTGLGENLQEALDKAYDAADKIQFEGKTLRRDIGWRALKQD